MRTRSALSNWSVPETTMRSPALSPEMISTLSRLEAPTWTGCRTALSPSTTYAVLPPSCSRKGPRSTISTSRRVSITMRTDSRWFCRRPGGCLPSAKRTRAVTSPFTTSGETAAISPANGVPLLVICAGMPIARSRAKLSGTFISTSNRLRSTTLSTGPLAITLVPCGTCTWPTWPSNGARRVNASTCRRCSTTTARWRSTSNCLLRASRPAPALCNSKSLPAAASPISAFFMSSCARARSFCGTAPPSKARW